jgi:hypothetical protein
MNLLLCFVEDRFLRETVILRNEGSICNYTTKVRHCIYRPIPHNVFDPYIFSGKYLFVMFYDR